MTQEYINSYYTASAIGVGNITAASGDYQCDVCVIGGGFTGVSTALHLAEAGYKVILLEASKIGWGASGRNGGQLHTGQRKSQSELEKEFGWTRAHELWQLAEEAKHLVKARILKHHIKCDYKSGLLHTACKPDNARAFEREVIKLRKDYHYNQLRYVPKEEVQEMLGTSIYHGGMLDMGAGHIHPLNYVLGLKNAAIAAGAVLFEQSTVLDISQTDSLTIKTQAANISADFAVLACNGYLDKLNASLAAKIMPINSFMLATEPLGHKLANEIIRDDVAVTDSKLVVDYYRLSVDKRLLFGGGENYSSKFPDDIAKFVRPHMLKVFPQLKSTKIDYAWGGTLAITQNRLPDFGQLEENIYYAQGFSGQGIGLATLAGKLISEAIAGDTERFSLLSELPTKPFPGGRFFRYPRLIAGMFYYSIKDKL